MGIAAKSKGGVLAAAIGACLLAPTTASARTAVHIVHRDPLPTVEVVDAPRRARLIDVRGPVQFGWGWSTLYRAPVYAMSFEVSASVFEITDTTWLHLTAGESAMVSALQGPDEDSNPALFGIDLGVGLSRYAPRGPAFLLTGTAGPRWTNDGRQRLRPDGYGVAAKAEIFPFYATVPALADDDRGWFRRFVLSGINLWGSARYDQVGSDAGNGWSGGLGMDMGRTLILPALLATQRHRQRR